MASEAVEVVRNALHVMRDQFDEIHSRYRRPKVIHLRPHRPPIDRFRILRQMRTRQLFFNNKKLWYSLNRRVEERTRV